MDYCVWHYISLSHIQRVLTASSLMILPNIFLPSAIRPLRYLFIQQWASFLTDLYSDHSSSCILAPPLESCCCHPAPQCCLSPPSSILLLFLSHYRHEDQCTEVWVLPLAGYYQECCISIHLPASCTGTHPQLYSSFNSLLEWDGCCTELVP